MQLKQYWDYSGEQNNRTTILTRVLFITYLAGLFWIIVLKFNAPIAYMGKMRSVNLVPFKRPLILNGKVDFGEMILNVLIFVPLGMYAGALFKSWNIAKQVFLFFLVSFICEASQYILKLGVSDITDIIDNTLGGIIGLLIFKATAKAFNDSVKAQKILNVVATTGTILLISLLLFLKMGHLWLFRMKPLHR